MKNHPGTMKNHENPTGTMINHENLPGTMKNQPETTKTIKTRAVHTLRRQGEQRCLTGAKPHF